MSLEEHQLTINQNHIANGIRGDVENCPLALCINEHFKERGIKARVSWCDIGLVLPNNRGTFYITTPPQVTDFLIKFDAGKTVEPVTFNLTFDVP